MARTHRIDINPARLQRAREEFGFSNPGACAAYIRTDPAKWKDWEEGKVRPTLNQLLNISKKLVVSDSWLTEQGKVSRQPVLPGKVVDYRSTAFVSEFRPKLRARALQLKARANEISVLALDLGYNRFWSDMLDVSGKQNDAKAVAKKIRDALVLKSDPVIKARTNATTQKERLAFWLERLAELGIVVMRVGAIDPDVDYPDAAERPPHDHLSGMAIHHDYTPIIVLSRYDSEYRQIFTLMHELAHLVKRRSACSAPEDGASLRDSASSSSEERFCDEVAQYVLLNPDNERVKEATRRFNKATMLEQEQLSALAKLSRTFGVSQACLAYALLPKPLRTQYFDRYRWNFRWNTKGGGAAGKGPKSEETKTQEWCSRVYNFWGKYYLSILERARYLRRFDDNILAEYLTLDTFGSSSPPSAVNLDKRIEALFEYLDSTASCR